MRKRNILLASTLVLIAALSLAGNSMKAAQDTIDVSHPLHDLFYNETTIPISQGTDESGQQIYTLQVPVPNYEQATLVWQISFAEISSGGLGNGQFAVLCAAKDIDIDTRLPSSTRNSAVSSLKTAIETGQLTSLNVKFVDYFGGEPAFVGQQSVTPAPAVGLNRDGAEALLLQPVQNLRGNHVVSAVALVSAPSLNISDTPLFLDGYIASAFDTAGIQANSPLTQDQQITYENCYTDPANGACRTPTPGAFCPTIRPITEYYIECRVSGTGQITVTGPYALRPVQVGGNCRLRVTRTNVRFPGQCNNVRVPIGVFRLRCDVQCRCT